MLKRYLILYKAGSEEHNNCVLSLLRYLVAAGAITISGRSPIDTPSKLVYELEVKTDTANSMLGQLCLEEVVDYRDMLDGYTLAEMEEAFLPDGDQHTKERIGFAFVDGQLHIMDKSMSNYTTLYWLHWHCGVFGEEVESTIRGSISDKRIRVYQGENFDIVDFDNERNSCWLRALCRKCHEYFNVVSIPVENGAIPAESGTEWEARQYLGSFCTLW